VITSISRKGAEGAGEVPLRGVGSRRVALHAHMNLSRERDIRGTSIYTWPVTEMERDWIDHVVERCQIMQPELPVDVYHVTGRISRIAARIAQREDEIFVGMD